MTTSLQRTYTDEQIYPSFDGNPMAESTLQYEWIVLIKENLERLFTDRDNIFIAGDLLWYPIAASSPCQAPDVMVIFGRPKGTRKSYIQHKEENIAPQVAFEILSESNKTAEGKRGMDSKLAFYEQYGIEEYYVYDPETSNLQGWRRQNEKLVEIAEMNNWISPRLGIRFTWGLGQELAMFFPDGTPFLSTIALSKALDLAQQQTETERQQRQLAQRRERLAQQRERLAQRRERLAQQRERLAQQQTETERQQRQLAQQEVEAERQRNQKLQEKLRELGIDPNSDL